MSSSSQFLSAFSLLLLFKSIMAQPDVSVWDPVNAMAAKWMNYPNEFGYRLQEEKRAFVSEDGDRKVNVRVYQVFPEPDVDPNVPSQHVMPIMQGMVQRMDGILWPRMTYFLEKGEEYDCRVEGNQVDSDHCNRHCTHQGRYCAPQISDELRPGRHGKDVVDEVLRRLCMDREFHGPAAFATYLQDYDYEDCFGKETSDQVKECSYKAMKRAGVDPESLKDCLEAPQDQEHPVLEENWQHFHKFSSKYHKSDLPQIDIDYRGVMPKDYAVNIREWSSELIFKRYCDAFPYCEDAVNKGKPLACQICNGCNDVEICLWTLKCDGMPLDIGKILSSARPRTGETEVDYTCGEYTPPTLPPTIQVIQETEVEQDDGPSAAGVYFRIAMSGVAMLIVGLAAVYYYRKKQSQTRRKAKVLERSIPPEKMYSDYNDEPAMDHSQSSNASPTGIAFNNFGASARHFNRKSKPNQTKNLAPMPSEDRPEPREVVVFDDDFLEGIDGIDTPTPSIHNNEQEDHDDDSGMTDVFV